MNVCFDNMIADILFICVHSIGVDIVSPYYFMTGLNKTEIKASGPAE